MQTELSEQHCLAIRDPPLASEEDSSSRYAEHRREATMREAAIKNIVTRLDSVVDGLAVVFERSE